MLILVASALACPPSFGPHVQLEGPGDCLQIDTPDAPEQSDDPEEPGVYVLLHLDEADAYRLELTNTCEAPISLQQVDEPGPFDLELAPDETAAIELPSVPDSQQLGLLVEVEAPDGAWTLLVQRNGGQHVECPDADLPVGCRTAPPPSLLSWLRRR